MFALAAALFLCLRCRIMPAASGSTWCTDCLDRDPGSHGRP